MVLDVHYFALCKVIEIQEPSGSRGGRRGATPAVRREINPRLLSRRISGAALAFLPLAAQATEQVNISIYLNFPPEDHDMPSQAPAYAGVMNLMLHCRHIQCFVF